MAEQTKTAEQLKLEETAKLGGTAIKPIGWDRTGWEAFQYMLWNPDTGEVLTRTPLSWLKITVFYCIYYTFLAGFWIACLQIFFTTLPEVADGPKWKQTGSLIGNRPGVGMRPRNSDKKIDSQMFVLDINDKNLHPSHPDGEGDINADYATRAQKFLEVYKNTQQDDYKTFDLAQLGDCQNFPYGYTADPKVAPCIFIKLNTIWDWTPEMYSCTEEDEHREGECSEHIAALAAKQDESIFVDCQGRYAADQEALGAGGLEYFPKDQSMPIEYYPYTGQVKECPAGEVCTPRVYHSPLVAVKVTPRSDDYKGQLIHIECRAYYKGVKHITKSKEGLVQFEVQIKDDVAA